MHQCEVAVVGAGPVGMCAALCLHARDVPVTIFEAEPKSRTRPGSRAIYVHGSSLRCFERNVPGLGISIADEGTIWSTKRTFWRGREVFSRTYQTENRTTSLPHFTSLPQNRTELYLQDAVESSGIDIKWDTPIASIDTHADCVTLVDGSGEAYQASYVIGADGAGSTIRNDLGIQMHGHQSEHFFLVVDVETHPDDPQPDERVFHYDHPEVDGRNVLKVPYRGGWRIDFQGTPEDDPEWLTKEEVVAEFVGTVLGDRYRTQVIQPTASAYQFKRVVATQFIDEHSRVLLAGEAAHLFPPFGARGMNSGVIDAEAAARAIAIARDSSPSVAKLEVELFAKQREAAAAWNAHAAGRALQYLEGETILAPVRKRVAAELARIWELPGEWLDKAPYGPTSGPPTSIKGKY